MNSLRSTVGAALSLLGCACVYAKEPGAPADKSAYHLFNPVPPELLRDMATDRPDKTEGPTTVDAGHVQMELDLASFSYDRHNPERAKARVETWSFGTVNFRVGLLQNVEFDVILEPWSATRTDVRSSGRTCADGFGDVTLRSKINLWGNDAGATAFGLIPYVKLPANQDDLGNDEIEGGLILPFSVELAPGWGLGLMTEIDVVADSDGRGHHAESINSVTLARELTGRLGAYVEFFSAVSAEPHAPWIGTVDVGLTFAVTSDLQIDAGINFGVTRAADDLNPFVGVSWRF